jgi:4a-hydroxytetrahydrobiopterin dehydratase
MPELLTSEEVQKNLTQLPGWAQSGDVITKTYSFKAYLDGVGFVNRVANAAEAADHHPDMAFGYKQVVVTLTTHSAKGITKKDFDLAADIEALV